MRAAAAGTGSILKWGMAAWPPLPVTVNLNVRDCKQQEHHQHKHTNWPEQTKWSGALGEFYTAKELDSKQCRPGTPNTERKLADESCR